MRMIPSKPFFRVSLFCLSVLAFVTSCVSAPEAVKLDEAACLMAEQPDSAYSLLRSIDSRTFRRGSENEARYALLCTQAQYKNYDDAPNDSLISIAVDYYEENGSEEDKFYAYLYQGLLRYSLGNTEAASMSLMRALATSGTVEDHYSKGQMYVNLSHINLDYHCSDARKYAWSAYSEFRDGGLDEYSANALLFVATSYLQVQNYDSCRILLEQAITEAKRLSSNFVMQEAISMKAQYALCVDSLQLAETMLQSLKEQDDYIMKTQDIASFAYVLAQEGKKDLAYGYLSAIRNSCQNVNDSIQYYCNSLWVSRSLADYQKTSLLQDTVLHLAERLLSEKFHHTAIASERDYSDWKYLVAEYNSRKKTILITAMSLLLLAVVLLFITIYRKRKLEIKYLQRTIEKLQLEKERRSKEYTDGLRMLNLDDFIVQMRDVSHRVSGLTSSDLIHLRSLFCQYLPHFEAALRELTSLNETEWNICMLLKLSFSPGDISFLLNRSPGAISSARIRMYNRVFHQKGRTNDWDDFIKSI